MILVVHGFPGLTETSNEAKRILKNENQSHQKNYDQATAYTCPFAQCFH